MGGCKYIVSRWFVLVNEESPHNGDIISGPIDLRINGQRLGIIRHETTLLTLPSNYCYYHQRRQWHPGTYSEWRTQIEDLWSVLTSHRVLLRTFRLNITETWADIVDMPVLESFASYLFMTINTVVPRMRGSRIMTFLQSLKEAKRRRRGPCWLPRIAFRWVCFMVSSSVVMAIITLLRNNHVTKNKKLSIGCPWVVVVMMGRRWLETVSIRVLFSVSNGPSKRNRER